MGHANARTRRLVSMAGIGGPLLFGVGFFAAHLLGAPTATSVDEPTVTMDMPTVTISSCYVSGDDLAPAPSDGAAGAAYVSMVLRTDAAQEDALGLDQAGVVADCAQTFERDFATSFDGLGESWA